MPWRLVLFILIFGIFVAFIAENLEHSCDISFGLYTAREVPVFVTIFVSFTLGLICALPLVMHIKKKRKDVIHPKVATASEAGEIESSEKIRQDAAEAKKRFFARRRGG